MCYNLWQKSITGWVLSHFIIFAAFFFVWDITLKYQSQTYLTAISWNWDINRKPIYILIRFTKSSYIKIFHRSWLVRSLTQDIKRKNGSSNMLPILFFRVFSIWKSLWVLQKACIKIMACASYTYFFFL